jgi:hypothetical protein
VLLGEALPDGALDAHVGALISGYGIPPHVAVKLPLTGPPATVAERLRSYASAGAQHIVLGIRPRVCGDAVPHARLSGGSGALLRYRRGVRE